MLPDGGCLLRQGAILPSVVGVVWGWTVAAVAVLPYALAVLLRASFPRALSATLGWLLATLAPLVLVDRLFYGTWTVRLLLGTPPPPLTPLTPLRPAVRRCCMQAARR